MRYAIISDIHSNLQALEAALKIIDNEHIDSIICLGDIIGYNANPIECLNLIRSDSRIHHIIRGNHDDMGSRMEHLTYTESREISQDALAGLDYSYGLLNHTDRLWLLSKPKEKIIDDPHIPFLISHVSPAGEGYNWGYILKWEDAVGGIIALKKGNLKLGFFGHTHLPTIATSDKQNPLKINFDMGPHLEGNIYELEADIYYLINCGSIGQPRTWNNKQGITSFGIFDSAKGTVEIKKFLYDISAAQKSIRKANYRHDVSKERLAERLLN